MLIIKQALCALRGKMKHTDNRQTQFVTTFNNQTFLSDTYGGQSALYGF